MLQFVNKKVMTFITCLLCSLHVYAEAHRLEQYVEPIQQSISLQLDPNKDAYTGITNIALKITQPTHLIRLHSKGLSILSASITERQSSSQIHLSVIAEDEYDILSLESSEEVAAGSYSLTIKYSGKFSHDAVGLYKFHDGGENYLASQFQAMKARTVFPSFDEPIYKIPFEVDVTTPRGYEVLSNTPVGRVDQRNNQATYFFKPTAAINTDVVALAVGKFKSLKVEGLPVPSQIYLTKGQTQSAEAMKRDIPKVFQAVQSYFAMDFPYQKLDFLVLPEYKGAGMENVGLITLNSDLVTFPLNGTHIGNYDSHKLLAHEIIHMWFGNLVTMKWWDDLWLNESFAEWLARKVTIEHFPEFKGELNLPQLEAFWDDTPTTKPIKSEIHTVDDYHAVGQIVYTKGHAVIAMVEEYVGEQEFKLAIMDYVKKFSGKNVSFEAFIAHMEKRTGKPLRGIFDSFLTQSQYPLITLEKKGSELLISQQPFASSNEVNVQSTVNSAIWHVPLKLKLFTTKNIETRTVLLTSAVQSITLSDDIYAVFPDASALGYFRYKAHFSNTTLTRWLGALTHKEKKSLLANNTDLVRGGHQSYASALELQFMLLHEPNLNQELATELFADLNNDFYDFVPVELQQPYIDYFYRKLASAIEHLRWYKKSQNGDVSIGLQARSLSFLGTKLFDDDAVKFAQSHYPSILTNTSELAPTLQNAVLNVVASNAGRNVFNQYKRAYLAAKNNAVKSRLIRYMGYFSYPNSVSDYYDFLFSNAISKQEFKGYYLQYPVYKPQNREQAIHYIDRSIEKLFAKVGEDEKQWQPYSFATACSTAIKNKLNAVFLPYVDKVSGLKGKLDNVNHMITQCEVAQNLSSRNLAQLFTVNSNRKD